MRERLQPFQPVPDSGRPTHAREQFGPLRMHTEFSVQNIVLLRHAWD